MIATAVFVVITMIVEKQPAYVVLEEAASMQECRKTISRVKNEEMKKDLQCVEIVLHNEKGQSYEKPATIVPPNNSHRLGTTT